MVSSRYIKNVSLDSDVLPLRPHLTEYDRPQTAPAVTQDDIWATEHTIEGLKFEMATLVRDVLNRRNITSYSLVGLNDLNGVFTMVISHAQ